jgi:DNA/RNA-binding protein KIN17
MPKAEVGSVKHLNKMMKQKGLQRLRWYCQACERQMRDENSFKQHTMSESHVRRMLLVGQDPKKAINEFSDQFLKDFLQLLRTGHGEKQVHINHFYQEYIARKDHVHMNATKWPSLTELAKYLGREGICRVEETEKGIHISWIDRSPEALKRQEALRRKEAMDKGDEELEQRMLREQIKRAQQDAESRGAANAEDEQLAEEARGLQRQEGEKVKLSFGSLNKAALGPNVAAATGNDGTTIDNNSTYASSAIADKEVEKPVEGKSLSLKFGAKPQSKNVFAQAKKNALASGGAKKSQIEQPKKMSEAERIMREEMERKRPREYIGFGGTNKRQKA